MSTVWYFAYGSNMQSATLRGRRGIDYRRALAARVPGWRLVLDKPGILAATQTFANIVPDPAAEVLGVCFEITTAELEHIELTEGVPIANYHRVAVPVEPFGAAGPGEAFSLASEQRGAEPRPTARYMDLLVDGAVEHGLPAAYVAWLRAVPTVPESLVESTLRATFEPWMRRRV